MYPAFQSKDPAANEANLRFDRTGIANISLRKIRESIPAKTGPKKTTRGLPWAAKNHLPGFDPIRVKDNPHW
jgi:hypothetical protein